MKWQFLAVSFCILATAAHAKPTSSPKLNMVIFKQKPVEQTSQPVLINQENGEGSLQMVVFNQNTPNQDTGTSETSSSQNELNAETATESKDVTFKTSLKKGYQRNNLNWNIAAPGDRPNILSELQWKKISSQMVEAGLTITYADSLQFEGNLGYGYTFYGRNQDSDYYLNNRQGEFSRSNNASNSGSILDFSTAVGYQFMFGNNATYAFHLTPKAGFSYHSQLFKMTDGVQTIPAYGGFAGLNSSYEATWLGPWAGITAEMLFAGQVSLQNSIAYHLTKYQGTGNWNLREDLQHPKSFKHKANGDGIVISSSAGYLINSDWTVRLSADYQRWKADRKGIDTVFGSYGGIGHTKLNEVNWNSYGFNLGVEYNF
jgi:hypothetical protein